jgi:hypothetical protein
LVWCFIACGKCRGRGYAASGTGVSDRRELSMVLRNPICILFFLKNNGGCNGYGQSDILQVVNDRVTYVPDSIHPQCESGK